GGEPLRVAEVFRAMTDGIWSELTNPAAAAGHDKDKDKTFALSTIRRNLQREHLRRLSTIVLGNRRSPYDDMFGYVFFFGATYPADARSLARMHLKEINTKIGKALDQKDVPVDDTTRAHLEECRFKIGKVLDAQVQANEP